MPQFCSHLGSGVLGVANIPQLQQFHAQLIQHALHRHDYWVARLLAFCTRLHAPQTYTCRIFDSAHQPSVMVFTNMLRYYSKCGANNEILTLFEEMHKCGLKPDACAYPVVIKAAGKGGVLFHSLFVKMGIDCGKYIRNALINAYGKHGPIESGRQLFDEMTERSVADWNAIISGYWNWGSEGEAKRLFDLMPDKNVITWTTMVTGYSKMKDLENARSYFDRMPEKSVVSWNAMLSGYAQNGFPEETLSLFNEMVGTGITPDETTLVAVISSCSSCGDPVLAESAVKTLGDRGVRLNPFIKTALLDLYAKCGRLEKAQKTFNELGDTALADKRVCCPNDAV
ncbi:Pentatricopeptide repeat-containing protein [Sesamum alatum]|uniref:Pentatricopeptide repeat-containing protein n=1 Tax=Sesamum alatum TaxID=300844 RepID=A0AAE2CJH3_9LAMI|nr:Pentatricopeptide repeat-containing protein [Sesamum alatum]